MRSAWIILTAISAALWAGCRAVPMPGNSSTPWSPPKEARSSDAAWTALREQKTDVSKPLALAELVDIALHNNPASRKAWNDACAAAAQVRQARGYFLPTVTGVASGTRQGAVTDPESFESDSLKYGPGLQVDYLIFNFGGGRRAAVEAALQTVYASNYAFNQSIQGILLSVETAYYNVISAQANIEAAEMSVTDATTTLKAATERRDSGVGTELDVLQARALYDQSCYQLVGVQGQHEIARGNLARTLGLPADTPLQLVASTNEVAETVSEQDLRRLIDESLQRRPDLAALRASLAAKEAMVKVAESPLWPSLYFNGTLNRNWYESYRGKEVQETDWAYGAGVSLRWTLFDGFQSLQAKRAALAQARSLRAQLEQAELAASADVWAQYHAYATALKKNKFSRAYLQSASASYDLALASYKTGLKSILDLLNAESLLVQARSQHIAARQDAFTALANLAYATGLLGKDGAEESRDTFSTPTPKDKQP